MTALLLRHRERPAIDDWVAGAICRGTATDLFFPSVGEPTAPAKRVCASCPVQADCADYALRADERHGVWGGLSERQRRRIHRSRAERAER